MTNALIGRPPPVGPDGKCALKHRRRRRGTDVARVGTWCGSSVGNTVDAAPPPVGGQPDTAGLGGSPAPRASSAPVLAMVVVDDEAPALEAVLAGLLAQDLSLIHI